MKICASCKYCFQCGDLERTAPCNGFELDQIQFNIAVERYNDCMFETCYEYCTIGTRFSENTENWNIRDMVAEVDYILSCYYEEGHARYEMQYDKDERKAWEKETKMLSKFIDDYKLFIQNVKCHIHHCSKYDN
jgi:hypothetical protein